MYTEGIDLPSQIWQTRFMYTVCLEGSKIKEVSYKTSTKDSIFSVMTAEKKSLLTNLI